MASYEFEEEDIFDYVYEKTTSPVAVPGRQNAPTRTEVPSDEEWEEDVFDLVFEEATASVAADNRQPTPSPQPDEETASMLAFLLEEFDVEDDIVPAKSRKLEDGYVYSYCRQLS